MARNECWDHTSTTLNHTTINSPSIEIKFISFDIILRIVFDNWEYVCGNLEIEAVKCVVAVKTVVIALVCETQKVNVFFLLLAELKTK